ncbi:MAG: hypothetical protein PHS57_04975, partial [Alphaproteobacteria bacterium]|nr:hypothetical protein [Alphaproteobacteria bacterium]
LAGIVLLFPASFIYTGKWPWDAYDAFVCPGKAYAEMLHVAQTGNVTLRRAFSLIAATFAPFVFCAVPFGLMMWEKLRRWEKGLLVLAFFCPVVFSTLRGTDKETADVVLALLLVTLVKGAQFLIHGKAEVSRRVVGGLVLVTLVGTLFAGISFEEKKKARYRDACSPAFLLEQAWTPQKLRAEENNVLTEKDIDDVRKIVTSSPFGMATAYLAQGYYGLSLTLNHTFEPMYGLGHSPVLMMYVAPRVSADFPNRSYLYKGAQEGWSDKSHWSTIVAWLANDISFYGVPFFFLIFGFFWARAWRETVEANSLLSLPFFCLGGILLLYFPANNQLAGTLGSYATTIFWFLLWVGARFAPLRRLLG